MDKASFPGGCGCGDVRYRLTSEPMFVNCCHCTLCQRQTGSAFVINALIETDRLEHLSGELERTTLKSGGGGIHDIYRCAKCRIAVWGDYGRRPWLRFLRVGTLDDPSQFPPGAHVFTSTKLPWVTLPQGVSHFDEYFDIREHWPQASLDRRQAAQRASS